MKMSLIAASAAVFFAAGAAHAASITETFDTAPVGWTVDRQAPAGFDAPVSFGGDNRLALTVNGSDFQSNGFRNTQGMYRFNPSGTTSVSVDLYLSAEELAADRLAGLWVFGHSADPFADPADRSSYGILEISNGGLRGWDSVEPGGWADYGVSLAQDTWITLGIELDTVNDLILYSLNGAFLGSEDALGSVTFGVTALQGHNDANLGAGNTRTAYFDNLTTSDVSAVPVPAALPLLASALGLLGLMRRRRSAA